MTRRFIIALLYVFAALPAWADPVVGPRPQAVDDAVMEGAPGQRVETWVAGLEAPWSLIFLPDGRALVSERPGRIRLIRDGALAPEPYAVLDVATGGEGGLMGLAIHPDFPRTPFVYAMHTYFPGPLPAFHRQNRVVRLRDQGGKGVFDRVVLDGIPGAFNHNGGRIAFGFDGMLYVATGETYQAELAQDRNSLAGKILRIGPEGEIPADNPFPGSAIYSWGHRNPQGLAWHPATKDLFASEHGPSGEFGLSAHDEINVVVAGGNYGWPRAVGAPGGACRQDDNPGAKDAAGSIAFGACAPGGACRQDDNPGAKDAAGSIAFGACAPGGACRQDDNPGAKDAAGSIAFGACAPGGACRQDDNPGAKDAAGSIAFGACAPGGACRQDDNPGAKDAAGSIVFGACAPGGACRQDDNPGAKDAAGSIVFGACAPGGACRQDDNPGAKDAAGSIAFGACAPGGACRQDDNPGAKDAAGSIAFGACAPGGACRQDDNPGAKDAAGSIAFGACAPGLATFRDPLVAWKTPTTPPSGIAFWRNDLFVATLRSEALIRIALARAGGNYRVERIERWFARGDARPGRLRDAVAGPDGALYLLTNNRDGRGRPRDGDDKILRLSPAR